MSMKAAITNSLAAQAVDVAGDETKNFSEIISKCITGMSGVIKSVAWSVVPKGTIERVKIEFSDKSNVMFSRFIDKDAGDTHITGSSC